MQGYCCMACREKREMRDVRQVTLKNGRAARQGTRAVRGTTITVMGGAKAAQGWSPGRPLSGCARPGRE